MAVYTADANNEALPSGRGLRFHWDSMNGDPYSNTLPIYQHFVTSNGYPIKIIGQDLRSNTEGGPESLINRVDVDIIERMDCWTLSLDLALADTRLGERLNDQTIKDILRGVYNLQNSRLGDVSSFSGIPGETSTLNINLSRLNAINENLATSHIINITLSFDEYPSQDELYFQIVSALSDLNRIVSYIDARSSSFYRGRELQVPQMEIAIHPDYY